MSSSIWWAEGRTVAEALSIVVRYWQAVPVTSPHGTLGSWMSGGALRAACGLGALLGRRVFPTVTRGGADPEAPLPGLVTAPVEDRELQAVVSWGHATGGASAAVVMQRHTYSGG